MARPSAITVRARAKINLDLRILGRRADGYHEVRTVLQTLAWHDTVTVSTRPRGIEIAGDSSRMPLDGSNLAWRAATALWRAAGRRGMPGVRISIAKRIPAQAGLGGGSSDAAAALAALNRLWDLRFDRDELERVARSLGADVPFFLSGGTALGLGRGDEIYPLESLRAHDVVVAWPDAGTATADAYRWFAERAKQSGGRSKSAAEWSATRPEDWVNDLQGPVEARRPEIRKIRHTLSACGAVIAAMSGSGSGVFGLFESKAKAGRAKAAIVSRGWHAVATRTLAGSRLVV